MSIGKLLKDRCVKLLLGKSLVPSGLAELNNYFRINRVINFSNERQADGSLVAISSDFRYGRIITSAKNEEELEEKIKDAILTAFEVPSSYAKDAGVHRVGERGYAFA